MIIDSAILKLINHSNETISLFHQYSECFECPFLKKIEIKNESDGSVVLRTFFQHLLVFSKSNRTILSPDGGCSICDQSFQNQSCGPTSISLRDQSRLEIIIDADLKCHFTLTESGQNEWINSAIVLAVYICLLLSAFYGYRLIKYYWNKRSNSTPRIDSPVYSSENGQPSISVRPNSRFSSIDSFRGITILLMIFVNYGAGQYKQLQHAAWDGLQLADVVFPFFIFIMGLSIAISFRNFCHAERNSPSQNMILKKISKRSLNLFILGIIVNSIGSADLKTIRIPGVLQRFSLSYGVVAIVHALSSNLITGNSYMPHFLNYIKLWPQYTLASVMLTIYTYFTFFWNYNNDCPVGYLGPGGLSNNISHPFCVGGAAHRIDEIIFSANHCYRNFFGSVLYDQNQFHLWHDPEGLLGVTTSIVLTLIGFQAGHILVHNVQPWARFRRWIKMIVILALTTVILVFFAKIPINKNLWSLSFVTANGCLATILFSLLHYFIDHKKIWPLGTPFHYPGQNAIILYIGHEIAHEMFPFKLANSYSNHMGYLAENLLATTVWWAIAYWMAINEIFIAL